MKLWVAIGIIAFVALLSVSPFSPLYWKLAKVYYEPKKQEAMRFCESLVPLVDASKEHTGHYPTCIDPEWIKGKKVPELIRVKHFYTYTAITDSYALYFWNPGDFWDDFWVYNSNLRCWSNFDANKPID